MTVLSQMERRMQLWPLEISLQWNYIMYTSLTSMYGHNLDSKHDCSSIQTNKEFWLTKSGPLQALLLFFNVQKEVVMLYENVFYSTKPPKNLWTDWGLLHVLQITAWSDRVMCACCIQSALWASPGSDWSMLPRWCEKAEWSRSFLHSTRFLLVIYRGVTAEHHHGFRPSPHPQQSTHYEQTQDVQVTDCNNLTNLRLVDQWVAKSITGIRRQR